MLTVVQHALVDDWVGELREVSTPPERFRALLGRLSVALFLEATRDLPTAPRRVLTPMREMEGRAVQSPCLLVPVLRAGLGMAEPILQLVPHARTCHVGLVRNHETLEASCYLEPQVQGAEGASAFVLDPMLATGGSASAALSRARRWGAADIRLLCIIGAPEGVERIQRDHPGVPIFLCALDEGLDEVGYIVPGLGDAGDRQFGT